MKKKYIVKTKEELIEYNSHLPEGTDGKDWDSLRIDGVYFNPGMLRYSGTAVTIDFESGNTYHDSWMWSRGMLKEVVEHPTYELW